MVGSLKLTSFQQNNSTKTNSEGTIQRLDTSASGYWGVFQGVLVLYNYYISISILEYVVFQNISILEYQNFRIIVFQNIKILEYQYFRIFQSISILEYLVYYRRYSFQRGISIRGLLGVVIQGDELLLSPDQLGKRRSIQSVFILRKN